jgi:hypothetical protein
MSIVPTSANHGLLVESDTAASRPRWVVLISGLGATFMCLSVLHASCRAEGVLDHVNPSAAPLHNEEESTKSAVA